MFEGFFEGRHVAVKRVPEVLFSQADIERSILIKSDGHDNIIRYHATEKCNHYMYLALQLCSSTLKELIEGNNRNIEIDAIDIVKQALEGLNHLHSLKPAIVHRDLTPMNILVSNLDGRDKRRCMLADLGFSKILEISRGTFTHSQDKGTAGWMAREMIEASEAISSGNEKVKLTLKVDIFAMGCIFHYVCSQGKHPFGDKSYNRPYNIVNNILTEIKIPKTHAYRIIIESMIHTNPEDRPSASDVLQQLALDMSKHGMYKYSSK